MDYDEFWKFHNKTNMDKHAISLIENQAKQIKELKSENERLKKWQIKPTEAICLTDLACRYKKVFKND